MTTRNVRLEFDAGSDIPNWSHMHPLPIELISEHNTPALKQLFKNKVIEACFPYQDEWHLRGGGKCLECNELSAYGFMSPISFLRLPDPFVEVTILPTCKKASCRSQVAARSYQNFQSRLRYKTECCAVCFRMEGVKRCAGCKFIAYCGTDHQKMDWAQHKKRCKEFAATYSKKAT